MKPGQIYVQQAMLDKKGAANSRRLGAVPFVRDTRSESYVSGVAIAHRMHIDAL
jgi:hypothetical protein